MPTKITVNDGPASGQGAAWDAIYRTVEESVRRTIAEVALSSGISERDLDKQLLLHLPRFSESQLADTDLIYREAERLAAKLELRRRDYMYRKNEAQVKNLTKSDLILRECEPEVARILHESFHYISSYHPGVAHLGLYMVGLGDLPIALASLAPMDLRRLDSLFPSSEDKKRILVLSRLFAFDGAPRNVISYLLGRVNDWVRRNLPEVRTLLTFLNPNLGFSGSSFRAANWEPFLQIAPIYTYLAGDYMTYRRFAALPLCSRGSVHHCSYGLQPLMLLRYDLGQ